jgi:hypothetical protein
MEGWDFPIAAINILHHDLESVLIDQQSYIHTNNHGAMVGIAFIHAAQIFLGLDSTVAELGWSSLKEIVGSIFDGQGVAGENSPEYQAFWISLLTPLAQMSRTWPIPRSPAWFDVTQVVSQAEDALGHFTDHAGHYLPIGDSHPGRSLVPPSRNTVLVTEEHGFACYSQRDTLLTFNCGHSNYAHKHCDDTSITLSYGGLSLILDSGYFGHDWRDDRVIYTKSQSAHSGLFLEEFDDLHPGRLMFPGRETMRGKLEHERDANVFVGTVDVQDGRSLQRRITIRGPESFLIEDRVTTPLAIESRAVRRFLFPAGAQIRVQDHEISVRIEDVLLRLIVDRDSSAGPVRVFSGVSGPPMRGRISPRLGQLTPCYCLELPIRTNLLSRLSIEIEAARHLDAVSELWQEEELGEALRRLTARQILDLLGTRDLVDRIGGAENTVFETNLDQAGRHFEHILGDFDYALIKDDPIAAENILCITPRLAERWLKSGWSPRIEPTPAQLRLIVARSTDPSALTGMAAANPALRLQLALRAAATNDVERERISLSRLISPPRTAEGGSAQLSGWVDSVLRQRSHSLRERTEPGASASVGRQRCALLIGGTREADAEWLSSLANRFTDLAVDAYVVSSEPMGKPIGLGWCNAVHHTDSHILSIRKGASFSQAELEESWRSEWIGILGADHFESYDLICYAQAGTPLSGVLDEASMMRLCPNSIYALSDGFVYTRWGFGIGDQWLYGAPTPMTQVLGWSKAREHANRIEFALDGRLTGSSYLRWVGADTPSEAGLLR